jgi:hypothetical protein
LKPYAYKRLGKPTGVVTASGQRLQLRTHTIRDLNRSGNGYFSLPAPRWRLEFNAMLIMLFGSAFAVSGAWIVPWDVADEYGKPSGLRVLGPWIDDPRVDQLSLGASYRLS